MLKSLTVVCTFQATAEQMRLAQVIFDKNDTEFEAKVKQVCF